MPSHKPWFLSSLALVLTACPATPVPTPTPQPVTRLTGTVVDGTVTGDGIVTKPWSGGAGHAEGLLDIAPLSTHTLAVIATGELAADGTFALNLPSTVAASALVPFDRDTLEFESTAWFQFLTYGMGTCTGGPVLSSPSTSSAGLIVNAVGTVSGTARPYQDKVTSTTTDTAAGTVTHREEVIQAGGLMYFDAPVTVSGTISCSATSAQAPAGTVREDVTFDLTLAKGWNQITQETRQTADITQNSSDSTSDITIMVKMTSGRLPTNEWAVMSTMTAGQGLLHSSSLFR